MVANLKTRGRKTFLAAFPDYRDVSFFEWRREGQNTLLEGICFVPADLASVTLVRDYLENKTKELQLNEEESFEFALICDELLTNGIIATYAKNRSENLILRYKIFRDFAIISVLDYGGGFDFLGVQKEVPEGDTLTDFLASLKRYREQSQSKVPLCGQIVDHHRFGRGLRIVTGLADVIVILFHNNEGKITRWVDKNTLGTVISVRYKFKSCKT